MSTSTVTPSTSYADIQVPKAPRSTRVWGTVGRIVTYAILLIWAVICLFPIYWTISTSFKPNTAVIQGPTYLPYIDFDPTSLGWDVVTQGSQGEIFVMTFRNS